MRLGIRLKFSIFLSVLLLLTVFSLSFFVLNGIRASGRSQYESILKGKAEAANAYFLVSLADYQYSHDPLFGYRLSSILHEPVMLYDTQGKLKFGLDYVVAGRNFDGLIQAALKSGNNYIIENDTVFYAAPLLYGGYNVGVVLFTYSIEQYHNFFSNTKSLFIQFGITITFISFLAGYFFYSVFARGIKSLIEATNLIKAGQFNLPLLKRRDELGDLSASILFMAHQIETTISDLRYQREILNDSVLQLTLLKSQEKQFIMNVTHEFKTPLTSIHAYLDLLDMYPGDDMLINEAKANIRLNSRRLLEMVEKVLYLSALERYDDEYMPQKTELSQCVVHACSNLKGKAERYDIKIESRLEVTYIWSEQENLTTIFLNLIDNAIKYNRKHGSIYIDGYIDDANAIVDISDTGTGIPPEHTERIFEPFYMTDKERARQTGGTGLGLTLVNKLIKKMNGSIFVLKTSREGSTFRLIFPVCQPDHQLK